VREAKQQNCKTAEVGRDLWRPSRPTPLLKQGHLELAAQDRVQMAFEYLQGGRLHSHLHGESVSWCSDGSS